MGNNTVGNIGLYLINGMAGNAGLAGAPILHFSLLVNPANGSISGQALQTRAIQGAGSSIPVGNVNGEIRNAVLDKHSRIVSLRGEAVIAVEQPDIGAYLVPFNAHFAINDDWEGKGGWNLGSTAIDNVPVSPEGD